LMGKRGHVRTVPVPDWVKSELGVWLAAAGIDRGRLFRRVNKVGKAWGEGMTVKAVWHIVKESAKCIGVPKLAPHDLRRYADSAMLRAGSWSRSNSLWARLSSNHRTVPWVHAANSLSRQ
jgi:integrase